MIDDPFSGDEATRRLYIAIRAKMSSIADTFLAKIKGG
jgi:hypothetical protein